MAKLTLLFLVATATLIQAAPAKEIDSMSVTYTDSKEHERNVLTVTGTLKCGATTTNSKQTNLVLISKHFFKDEKVEGAVGEDGKFEVTMVSTSKSMEPVLQVYTGCAKGSNICKRKLKFAVPTSAVNQGGAYSIGEVDLEKLQVGEDRECSSSNVVTVTGTLLCDGKPAEAKDTYFALLNRRTLQTAEKLYGAVQEGGKFEITMTSNSKSMNPELHVYTECNKGNNKCKRKLNFAVPTAYVNEGTNYSIGQINMEKPMVGEGRDSECN